MGWHEVRVQAQGVIGLSGVGTQEPWWRGPISWPAGGGEQHGEQHGVVLKRWSLLEISSKLASMA